VAFIEVICLGNSINSSNLEPRLPKREVKKKENGEAESSFDMEAVLREDGIHVLMETKYLGFLLLRGKTRNNAVVFSSILKLMSPKNKPKNKV
jgi:hypothetical protein